MTKRSLLFVLVGVMTTASGCGKHSAENTSTAAQSTAQAASPEQSTDAAASAPRQAALESDPPASQERSASNPDLDGLRVDVVDQGTTFNDWSQSEIRVIKATRESGGDIYLMCAVDLIGANGKPIVISGKPWKDSTCFAPKLRTIYTLHDVGTEAGMYYMHLPDDDGSDAWLTKRPMVRYCPKCDPNGDSQ